MLKTITKRKLSIFIIAVIVFIAACLLLFRHASASAEGNNAGSADSEDLITVTMDVNGVDAESSTTGVADDSPQNIKNNDSGHFKVRHFYSDALSLMIDANDTKSYVFVDDSVINGSNSIDVEIESGQKLKVTALSATAKTGAHFSVKMQPYNDSTVNITVYMCVVVQDTFVMLSGTSSTYYVGYELNADRTKEIIVNGQNITEASSYADGKHAAIVNIDNYTNATFDLGELLEGRALYNGDTAVKQSDNTFWVLDSVKNFTIETVTFPNSSDILSKVIKSNPTSSVRIAPSFTGRIGISSNTVGRYAESNNNADFFADTHLLLVTLSEVGNTNAQYTIYIPVKFNPANPQENSISSAYLRLNVTSQYKRILNYGKTSQYVDMTTDEPVDETPNDYCAIVVTPQDLVDYACPASYRQLVFDHEKTTVNGSTDISMQEGCRVEIEGADQSEYYPTKYRITALKSNSANSNFTVRFVIEYETLVNGDTARASFPVELAIETYGGYTISFSPIKGKKAVTYNSLTSGVFAEMRRRGYMLQKAEAKHPDILSVDFSNNVLTLDPQVEKINGRANATVKLTFINNKNQTITFDSELVNIDVNAGSLFARFEDWQAWLIIAACILGGIILILLIVWLFIHSISKHKQDELATQAPVSSYIVKLNSTIAATQAQQRMAQTQALSQASTMLLGVGPTGTAAPPPDTLQLASGIASVPGSMSTPSTPLMSEPQAARRFR